MAKCNLTSVLAKRYMFYVVTPKTKKYFTIDESKIFKRIEKKSKIVTASVLFPRFKVSSPLPCLVLIKHMR